jgi:hypothetical protein
MLFLNYYLCKKISRLVVFGKIISFFIFNVDFTNCGSGCRYTITASVPHCDVAEFEKRQPAKCLIKLQKLIIKSTAKLITPSPD